MGPDACAATPRAPHVWLHVQDTCRTPPLLPYVRLHDCNSCKAPQHHTHGWPHASGACADTPRAWLIHLVLLLVKLHLQLPCTVTPRASVDTQLAGQLTPRYDHMQRATSSFSVCSSDFDSFGEFSSHDQSKIFFYGLSDALNNFNKLHLISEVEGKYVPSLRLPRKIS
ncbi:hypothetical protein DY000_02052525 [Brassica cretica]|uniref:Uncharacterized protein n=1 Tax=Brassica cretica TaxID=69181 RepID=A0ABQ7ACX7_BRACR|nr:hypothetical protein DY000_02052525 [Brassica cretica]